MDQNSHLLLTGGQGRVAKALRTELERCGWSLGVYSRNADGTLLLANEDLFSGTGPLNAKALIHCAWSTVPSVAEKNPKNTDTIDLPFLNKLIARLKKDPNPPILFFMSTGAVYGPADKGPGKEGGDTNPLGEYAKGKLAAEELVANSGLNYCILRVANLYGMTSKADDPQGVIARLAHIAIEGGTFKQWGEKSVKDYLHITDFANALDLLLRLEKPLPNMINVASGEPTKLVDLIGYVEKAVGHKLNVELQEAAKWDVTDNQLDITVLKELTGWTPEVGIEAGVHKEVEQLQGPA